MVKTSYGILGKDVGLSDKKCGLKKINIEIIINYVKDKKIILPIFQRELQEDKVCGIVEEFINRHKNEENFLIKHGYALSLCKIGKLKELYLIDGQHRLESMKRIFELGYNPEVIIRIELCDSINDMKKDFKLLNMNSKIPLIYTFEDEFIQNTLIELKNLIKEKYGLCFGRNNSSKTTNRMHIDSFMELFDLSKMKEMKDLNKYDLLNMIENINEEIKEMKELNGYNSKYYINAKDNDILKKVGFYLCLKNIKWVDKLFVMNSEYIIETINYKKKNIPKSLKIQVKDRDIGKNEYMGKCFVCSSVINRDNCHIGHIIPEYKGGETKIDNLKAICISCNLSMGTNNLFEFKDKYF